MISINFVIYVGYVITTNCKLIVEYAYIYIDQVYANLIENICNVSKIKRSGESVFYLILFSIKCYSFPVCLVNKIIL